MALRPRGHDICILDLLHGCDNMINRLANEAKLALLLFLSMVLKLECQADWISFVPTIKPNMKLSYSGYHVAIHGGKTC